MAQKLDEGSSTPLYVQLRELLRQQILAGMFAPGTRIPSEDKLNNMYGVSRITIRRALQDLVGEGLLVKRVGKGTYVNERFSKAPGRTKVAAKFPQDKEVNSFTEACETNGQRAGAHLLALDEVAGFEDERGFFGFGEEGRLIRVVRIRTADDVPIMVEENYFPAETYGFLLQADFENTSLFDIVSEQGHGDPILNEPCALDLEKASVEIAPYLDVPSGEPLFCLFGRYFDSNGAPMYLGKQHIVGVRYTFRI